jgi:putative ABC transport system permease protein
MWSELRYAIRLFVRHRSLFLTAVTSIILGIAPCFAAFALFDSICLQPLPFDTPSQLVRVWQTHADRSSWSDALPPGAYDAYSRELSDSINLSAYIAGSDIQFTLGAPPNQRTVPGAIVTTNLFDVLGVQPILGRTFVSRDETTGNVAIVSQKLWMSVLGSSENSNAKTLLINRKPYQVIGVIPDGFAFPQGVEVWVPGPARAAQILDTSFYTYFLVIGRLKHGASITNVQQRMESLDTYVSTIYPNAMKGAGVRMVPLQQDLVGDTRSFLVLLLFCTSLVLMAASVNVSGLMLTFNIERTSEFAMRVIQGATPLRIMGQLVAESSALCVPGAIGGMLIGYAAAEALPSFFSLDQLTAKVIVEWRTAVFAAALTAASVLIAVTLPAWRLLTTDINALLRQAEGPWLRRTQRAIMIAEVCLASVLCVAAALMARSIQQIVDSSPGFITEGAVVAQVELPVSRYPLPRDQARSYDKIEAAAKSLPGVTRAGLISIFPLGGDSFPVQFDLQDAGQLIRSEGDWTFVTAGYFNAMGIVLRYGRTFDSKDSRGVAVIDAGLARLCRNQKGCLGERVSFLGKTYEIIGVVSSVRQSPWVPQRFQIYIPDFDAPLLWPSATLVLRSNLPIANLSSDVENRAALAVPGASLFKFQSLTAVTDATFSRAQFTAWLLSGFAFASVVLCFIAVYGIVGHIVLSRRKEFGIRLALGAEPRQIMRGVFVQSTRFVIIGVLVGTVAAYWATQGLAAMLFHVRRLDAVSYVVAFIVVAVASGLATYPAAASAARTEPAKTLRAE